MSRLKIALRPQGVSESPADVPLIVDENVTATSTVHGGNGSEFNIIRAVREHVPARIDAINAELERIQRRERELNEEHETLMRLLGAVTPPNF